MAQEIQYEPTLTVYRESFYCAMFDAIAHLEAEEKKLGYTGDSARLATYRMMLKTCRDGGGIRFRD